MSFCGILQYIRHSFPLCACFPLCFVQLALDIYSWTVLHHIAVWGSIIVYFLFYLVFYSSFVFGIAPQGSYFGVQNKVYAAGSFWLCVLLTPAIAILPFFAYRSLNIELYPTVSDNVRRMCKRGQLVDPVKLIGMRKRTSAKTGSVRLGYAFAQEDRLAGRINSVRFKRSKKKAKKQSSKIV